MQKSQIYVPGLRAARQLIAVHLADRSRVRHALLLCAYRALGAGVAIGIMEFLGGLTSEPFTRIPFVTSIVLVMALPKSEAAQPRAIIGGHLLSSACGLLCYWMFGPEQTASAVAVGFATFAMIACRAVHPPAGIDAFLVPAYQLSVQWVVSPVLAGSLLLACYSAIWQGGERWFKPIAQDGRIP